MERSLPLRLIVLGLATVALTAVAGASAQPAAKPRLRVGTEGNYTYYGRSVVFDPAGELLAQAGPDEEILIADCDLDLLRRKAPEHIGQQADLREPATRRCHRGARSHEVVQQHAFGGT